MFRAKNSPITCASVLANSKMIIFARFYGEWWDVIKPNKSVHWGAYSIATSNEKPLLLIRYKRMVPVGSQIIFEQETSSEARFVKKRLSLSNKAGSSRYKWDSCGLLCLIISSWNIVVCTEQDGTALFIQKSQFSLYLYNSGLESSSFVFLHSQNSIFDGMTPWNIDHAMESRTVGYLCA